jgi:preprotein translocase subunit SecA
VLNFIEALVGELVDGFCSTEARPEEWDLAGLVDESRTLFPLPDDISEASLRGMDVSEIKERLLAAALGAYEAKVQSVGADMMRELERLVLLQTLDRKWIDHLYAMDALREGIGLRAYGQANPLIEYQKEGYALFEQLKHDVLEETVKFLYIVQVQPTAAPVQPPRPAYRVTREDGDGARTRGQAGGAAVQVRAAKVGRNDPCPCGSGKKYKKCHGRSE